MSACRLRRARRQRNRHDEFRDVRAPDYRALRVVLFALAIVIGCDGAQAASPSPVGARNGMVVTSQHLATKVGVDILKQGGNAIDAAVAVGYALGVVFPAAANLGGGGFMTVQLADGRKTFIDFRETAPLAATADMYLDRDGNVIRGLSTKGYLAAGVPGNVAGFELALAKYGTMKRAAVMAPAIRLAQRGFVLEQGDVDLARHRRARSFAKTRRPRRSSSAMDSHTRRDNVSSRTDLARTLERIARHGNDGFYRGPDCRRHRRGEHARPRHHHQGGSRAIPGKGTHTDRVRLSRLQDRVGAASQFGWRDHLRNPRRARRLSAGEWGFRSAQAVHYQIEAMRHAYVDRNSYLGDPDFVRNPIDRLLDKKYAAQIRAAIDPGKAGVSRDMKAGVAPHEGDEHHALFDRRQGRQRRGGHLHAERMVRREGHAGDHRHRHERRDGRLHRQGRRRERVWAGARRGQRDRPGQAAV